MPKYLKASSVAVKEITPMDRATTTLRKVKNADILFQSFFFGNTTAF